MLSICDEEERPFGCPDKENILDKDINPFNIKYNFKSKTLDIK